MQLDPALPPVTTGMVVVFAIVFLALLLFVTERVPVDVTALIVLSLLVILEPWTTISVAEALSGFSNEATITVLAMLILSEGVRRTGVVQVLGVKTAALVGNSERKQLAATVGLAGPASAFINNTPVVALLVPVVSDLAHQGRTSPSKLLIPLSYASMLGGTLTLIGTSTNILASGLSAQLLDHPFGMFEFTQVGVIVFAVGALYLVTFGPRLLPERVLPRATLREEYDSEAYLTEAVVREGSPLVGRPIEKAFVEAGVDVDVLTLLREEEPVTSLADTAVDAEDVFVVDVERDTLAELVAVEGVDLLPNTVEDREQPITTGDDRFVEIVVPSGSDVVGATLVEAALGKRYDATVFALRRGGSVIHERLLGLELAVGDTLLVRATETNLERLAGSREFIVAHEVDHPDYRREKIPVAFGVLAGVIGLAALEIVPIVVSALGGVVVMVLTGVLEPAELYDGVDWSVVVLLAGVIPLGIAMTETGAAAYLGALVAASASVLPVVCVLYLFYLLTGLLTEVVSNNASVALMIPVGVSAAQQISADPFAFVLAVTFAASTAFMTPVGYQTNLFVYGPGGYRFSDFFRVGAPLQLLLSVVTTAGIVVFFGV